ncbi:uncharacterized protein LOC135221778 isoform X1 [Macrobrachium nipponense]|uniref:uncharacterized protein LOC135221778 isoform X1 n=1 Tax=Macrobrachium nipponense TaxID=159736 RepID=UPI0030C8C15B
MGRYTGKKCRLLTMFTMTASFFLVELLVGYITNSMALVADSFHMLSDVLALIIAFLSVKMSPKKWSKNTFGWARAEVLGALVNSVFLMALCFSIFVESLNRLYEPEALHNPKLILIVGVCGLVVNIIGLALFHQHGHGHSHGGHSHDEGGHKHRHKNKIVTINALVATDDNENDERFTPSSLSNTESQGKKGGGASQMNMRGVFLHILSDALGSVIVIISALVVWLTEWEYSKYIDPGLSLCLVTLISISTWPLLKDSALILLQTVPTHIQVDGIQKQLLNVDGVLAVHEFHVWQLAGERIIASAHIRCRNLKDYMVLAEKIKKMFHEEGIHSTTIQPEFVEFEDDNLSASIESAEDCILDCPSNDKDGCAAQTCCGVSKQVKSASNPSLRGTANSDQVLSHGKSLQLAVPSASLHDVSKKSASPACCYPHWIPPNASKDKENASTRFSSALTADDHICISQISASNRCLGQNHLLKNNINSHHLEVPSITCSSNNQEDLDHRLESSHSCSSEQKGNVESNTGDTSQKGYDNMVAINLENVETDQSSSSARY